MSIQINPYISALQETQKAPVSKTQEKSEAGRFGALLEEKQKQPKKGVLKRMLADVSKIQAVGKKYQSFGRSAEAFERGDG